MSNCLHVYFETDVKKVLVKRSNIFRVGKLKHRAGFLESLQGGDSPVYKDQVGIFFSSCYCASWYSKCNCKKDQLRISFGRVVVFSRTLTKSRLSPIR